MLVPENIRDTVRVSPCPPHITPDGDLSFASVAAWVQQRIAFIQSAISVDSREGLKRILFGFTGILWVLRKQFGHASDPLVEEMALAKQISDEAEGILEGGFARVSTSLDELCTTIYVESEATEELSPTSVLV